MFITLEGPDGSGKSSQIAPLMERLKLEGYDAIATREPGGTEIGDQIRKVLFDMKNKGMHPRSEILLFQSSRAQIVEELIKPALAEGKIVISDRYSDSTLAYQGYGHGVDLSELRQIVDYATGGLKPELSILFDLDAQEGLVRRNNGGDWNRLDDYDIDFHKRVRAGYHALVAEEPARWQSLDASRTPEAVAKELQTRIIAFLAKDA